VGKGTVRTLVADPGVLPSSVAEPETGEVRPSRTRISPKSAKAKGKEFENQIAQMLREALGLPESDIKRARAGNRESDIQLSDEARRRFPYHIECKNSRTAQVPAWIKQMESDLALHRKKGTPYRSGMVVFKEHGNKTPYALIRFDHLLRPLLGRGEP